MTCSLINDDVLFLARTIYGEARNQPLKGMVAVGFVVKNRVLKARKGIHKALYGKGSYEEACLAKWQFSCWNLNDPNRNIIQNLTLESASKNKVFANCLSIAKDIVNEGSEYINPIGQSTHYYADYLDKKDKYGRIKTPAWAKGLKPFVTIGNHIFFENVP